MRYVRQLAPPFSSSKMKPFIHSLPHPGAPPPPGRAQGRHCPPTARPGEAPKAPGRHAVDGSTDDRTGATARYEKGAGCRPEGERAARPRLACRLTRTASTPSLRAHTRRGNELAGGTTW